MGSISLNPPLLLVTSLCLLWGPPTPRGAPVLSQVYSSPVPVLGLAPSQALGLVVSLGACPVVGPVQTQLHPVLRELLMSIVTPAL